MLRNYLKITFRNLWRQKGYALINILGLAIGLASCMIIMLYVFHELSYDTFNTKTDRIYRVANPSILRVIIIGLQHYPLCLDQPFKKIILQWRQLLVLHERKSAWFEKEIPILRKTRSLTPIRHSLRSSLCRCFMVIRPKPSIIPILSSSPDRSPKSILEKPM